MRMKSYFRAQKQKNDRDAREWKSICRELRKLFPDMSKASRALSCGLCPPGISVKKAGRLYRRMKSSGLWDTFSIRCRSAEQGLRSWESVTDPLK